LNFALIKRLSLIFVALILFYLGSLTAVFCLPTENIEKHAVENIKMLVVHEPGAYRFNRDIKLLCDGPASYVDALTDAAMLTRNTNFNKNKCDEAEVIQNFFKLPCRFADNIYNNPFLNALNMNGYARYWQGYEIVLRPLLVLFNYVQIRYFNIVVFGGLVAAVAYMFWKHIGKAFTVFFLLGLVMCKFPLIPLSMQFMNMFVLMLVALLVLQKRLNNDNIYELLKGNYSKTYEWSFILGSLTIFFDFLTTPLLPWGMCTLFLMVYCKEKHNYIFPWSFYIKNGIAWWCSCVLTWMAKWGLCTVFLGNNMFLEAYKQIIERMSGEMASENGIVVAASPMVSLMANLRVFFEPVPSRFVLIIIALFLFLLPYLKHKFSSCDRNKNFERQLLLLSLLPCLWYMLIVNHSQIHFWFTYRSLLISFMAICWYCYCTVAWRELLGIKED